ncbi:MAG: hypothetical protein Kow00114_11080 [Kiloniellaceae bacterium]
MIEQRSVLKRLNEQPVTETANWILGEPSVQEMLIDPVIHAVLRRDGLSLNDLLQAVAEARRRLAARAPAPAIAASDAA